MNDHEAFLLLAAKRILEPLTREEESDLEAHLASCPSCRAIATGMRRDDIRVRAALTPVAVAPRVRDRVLAEAAGSRRPDTRLLLVLAAALVLALVGVPFIAGRPTPDQGPTAVPSASVASVGPSSSTPLATASESPSASVAPSPALEPSPSIALPTGAGPFIAGTYTYGIRRDSLAARLKDGEVSGEWWRSTTVAGRPQSYAGPITCLVIDGKDAWLAGRVATATDGRTDLAIFFRLHDGGPGGDGDQAIGYLSNPGQTLTTMETWCATRYTPAGPFPLTSGDLVVEEEGR